LKEVRVRLRFFLALFILTLFLFTQFSHASTAYGHGCASPIPPLVPSSPFPAPAIPGKLLINEILSLPASSWNCSEVNKTYSIKSDSWIELYNPQSQPYNLYAAHASLDTGPNTLPFYVPLGAVIAPHGYLVLFPSVFSGTLLIRVHLRLIIAGVIIDQINIPSLPSDQSYARISDGSNMWHITNAPTIEASNNIAQPSPKVSPITPSPTQGPAGSEYAATPTSAPIIGRQIVWSNLQLPTSFVIATPKAKPLAVKATSSSLSSPASDGWDTPHRIVLTTLIVALALMLLWCCRLFTNS
jgi:hypothetical protein